MSVLSASGKKFALLSAETESTFLLHDYKYIYNVFLPCRGCLIKVQTDASPGLPGLAFTAPSPGHPRPPVPSPRVPLTSSKGPRPGHSISPPGREAPSLRPLRPPPARPRAGTAARLGCSNSSSSSSPAAAGWYPPPLPPPRAAPGGQTRGHRTSRHGDTAPQIPGHGTSKHGDTAPQIPGHGTPDAGSGPPAGQTNDLSSIGHQTVCTNICGRNLCLHLRC